MGLAGLGRHGVRAYRGHLDGREKGAPLPRAEGNPRAPILGNTKRLVNPGTRHLTDAASAVNAFPGSAGSQFIVPVVCTTCHQMAGAETKAPHPKMKGEGTTCRDDRI